jgi:hypothetical protein
MEKDRVLAKLVQAARGEPANHQVPLAFEKRIMARIRALPRPDAWTLWTVALWRMATPCAGLAIFLCAWMLYQHEFTRSGSLTNDLDHAVLAAFDLPGEPW